MKYHVYLRTLIDMVKLYTLVIQSSAIKGPSDNLIKYQSVDQNKNINFYRQVKHTHTLIHTRKLVSVAFIKYSY